MALDYDTANTGIFYRGGKLIKYELAHASDDDTLVTELKAIADPFEAADMTIQIADMFQRVDGLKDNCTQLRQFYAGYFNNILTDYTSVVSELDLPFSDINLVLPALIVRMKDDAKTVLLSTVTLGSTTAKAANVGNGTVLWVRYLDGWNGPANDAPAHIKYANVLTEMCVAAETMTVDCVSDSYRDGRTAGGETFSWSGEVPYGPFDWHGEGSGSGPSLNVANESFFIITDGQFENWGGTGNNTPTNWDVDNGTAGTHIFRNSTTSFVYRGTYSLKLTGDGAQATIQISQSLSPSKFNAKRMYMVTARVKGSAVPSAGDLTIQFAGTGYTPAAPTAETQTVQISGTPTGGNYTLTFTGPHGGTQTTGNIAYNAASSAVQTALRLLTGLEAVVVTTSAGAPPDVTHLVDFRGCFWGNLNQLTYTDNTTGGSHAITIATTNQGVGGEKIDVTAAHIPTTWALCYFPICMPASIPSDWELQVKVTGTLENTKSIYIDDISISEVQYHGGIGCVIVAGSTPFVDGDRFTWSVANDAAGKINTFFRVWFRYQLPSSSSPNISDSLAA